MQVHAGIGEVGGAVEGDLACTLQVCKYLPRKKTREMQFGILSLNESHSNLIRIEISLWGPGKAHLFKRS